MCFNFAVHFWAPTFKWGITIANIPHSSKPPEQISYAQQSGWLTTVDFHTNLLTSVNFFLVINSLLLIEMFFHPSSFVYLQLLHAVDLYGQIQRSNYTSN